MNSKLKLFSKIVGVVLSFSAGLIIVSVVFPLSDKTFRPVNARNLRNRIKLIWLQVFGRILNLKVEVEGEAADGAAMIVGNHVSWLDIVAIGRHLPGYFVAKNDILSWPVVGFISRQVGTVFVARGDKQAIHTTTEQMTWLLKQNAKVFAFPEGTT
ncbi:MAG: lysophospholipid acyltransferase family protein, partial [Gammaproteobacteria bacterium]